MATYIPPALLFAISLIIFSLITSSNMALALETNLTLETQLQWSELGVSAASENNPDNNVFDLPEQRGLVELRPRFTLDLNSLSANVEPRLVYFNQKNENQLDEDESEASIRYWKLNWNSENIELGLGKTVMLWGPSVIFSPSNRYHNDNGSSSPNSELLAREFVEAAWYINNGWDIEFIGNVGEGDQNLIDFEPSADIRLNWIGEASKITTQVSWLNPGWGVGGTMQWTVNDGLLVYLDGLYAPFSTLENRAAGFTSPTQNAKDSEHHLRFVSGLSYTFENGFNIALDYYYNGSGFDQEDSRNLLEQNNQAVSQIFQGGGDENSVRFIRKVNSLPTFSISKNYAVSRLSKNNLLEIFSVGYILIENLDDNGRQHILTLDCDCGDRLSVFATTSHFSGDTLTEFGRFFNSQFTIGFQLVLF